MFNNVLAAAPAAAAFCRMLLQVLPEAPRELVEELSRRYVYLYERITGQHFVPPPLEQPVGERMLANMASKYL
jgi:phosphoribosylaminoimidazole-succinocarboxamide synthase